MLRIMSRWSASLGAVTALFLVFALAGCGDDDSPPGSSSSEMRDEMSDMPMHEPDATPADEMDGDVTRGDFQVLDTAPPGSEGVTGQAWLGQNDAGTTVTIRLEGLEPDTEYVAHLHAQPCAEDAGGPHFQFDPGGEEVPPNEVHLSFDSDGDGSGWATVTNERRVEDRAPAVVVHPAEATDNRLACADFS